MSSYAVIGAGAIGGFYGARLARAGSDVHFLFRDDAEYVAEKGLEISSPDGDFVLHPVSAHVDSDTMPQVDVALVAVKAQVNYQIAPLLSAILKPGGSVLLIQNGLGSEELIYEAVGADHQVIGGLAFIQSERTGRNRVSHFALGLLTMGRYVGDYEVTPISDEMSAIAADLAAAGIESELSDDLLMKRYQKLLWNTPFNALSVILNATTSQMIFDSAIYELIETVMEELVAAAAADGRTIDPAFIELLLEGTKGMPGYSTSMKVDFDAGRSLEIDGMVGEPVRRAARNGVAMPATATLYRELQFINARLANLKIPATNP